jgi:hypothetical protein
MRCRFALVVLVALLSDREVTACSLQSWSPDDLVTNEPVYSANGRFSAIVRWNDEVADFTSERAGKAFGLDNPKPDNEWVDVDSAAAHPPDRTTVPTAVYESTDRRNVLLGEIPLPAGGFSDVLVSDSGKYIIAVQRYAGCSAYPGNDDPLVSIYRTNGSLVGVVRMGEIANDHDRIQLQSFRPIEFALRHESDTREVVVITIPSRFERDIARVDVTTGKLLDEASPIFPAPHTFVTPASDEWQNRTYAPNPECAAAIEKPDVIRMDSARFLNEALLGPLPEYPIVALKARVSGFVRVRMLVSERGEVLCFQTSAFPFGVDLATAEAAPRWLFRPLSIDGHRVKFTGEFIFHFEDVYDEKWKEAMRNSPPNR